ncbi:MAG: TetR/AcrR family transcriptional regulator [Pseudomonadota bacterium]
MFESSLAATPPPSKREANKLDKLERIKRAALLLFTTMGYDEATTRAIAAHAEVALGTVFTYASNKRDLLFLVANDMLDDTCVRGESLCDRRRPLQENVVLFCGAHYVAFAAQPELSRLVMRELLFYDSGVQAERAVRNRSRILRCFEHLILNARDKGEVKLDAPVDLIAGVIFGILQAEIRRWLALDKRDLEAGLVHLWSCMSLVTNGMALKGVALEPGKSQLQKMIAVLSADSVKK